MTINKRKKPRKKKSKIYFGTPAQDAIIKYNECNTPSKRSKIYEEGIQKPFEKLAENVMHTWDFQYFDIPKIDVQADVVSVMVEKMHMYQPDKGRAFSYFTIVARNHLILLNNGNYKRWKQTALISEMPETWSPSNDHYDAIRNSEYSEFKKIMLDYWENHLTEIFTKRRDIQIADSILELFRRSENIENFNKKHLYLLVREMTNFKTHYITKVVNVMKVHQKKLLNEYLETGEYHDNEETFWQTVQ